MKTLYRTPTLAAALLAAVTLSAPLTAQAQSYGNATYSYEDCKKRDADNKITGGIIGAIAGGVIGSQVAGNGARTEGSVLGAAIGAAAGAGIGGEKRDCKDIYRRTGTTHYSGSTYAAPTTYGTTTYSGSSYRTVPARTYGTTTYGGGSTTYGGGYSTYGSGYTTTRHSGYHRPAYNHGGYGGYDPLARVDRRIDRLRREGRRLRDQARYDHSPWLRRQIRENDRALERAKDRRREIKRNHRRADRRAARHYHGSNVCYEYH